VLVGRTVGDDCAMTKDWGNKTSCQHEKPQGIVSYRTDNDFVQYNTQWEQYNTMVTLYA